MPKSKSQKQWQKVRREVERGISDTQSDLTQAFEDAAESIRERVDDMDSQLRKRAEKVAADLDDVAAEAQKRGKRASRALAGKDKKAEESVSGKLIIAFGLGLLIGWMIQQNSKQAQQAMHSNPPVPPQPPQ